MNSGQWWSRCCDRYAGPISVVVHGTTHVPSCMVCSGCWAPGRSGVNCPKDIRLSRRVTAGSSDRYKVGSWNWLCGDWRSTSMIAVS
jgi:hypothetical protein